MALRQDKDRAKAQQEKFQAILSAMLKDEDNKYCEDCDAKGPRWASWNLGIFLCIRCAGIHRNLGVHISKVKSVNLDTWTAEQVAMMQEMGNSRARAVYEANVPDDFRRPQTNSAVEAFIRSKYENKKYIAREWVPPKPVVPKEWFEDDKVEKKKPRSKPTPSASANSSAVSSTVSVERRGSNAKPAPPRAPEPKPAPAPQPAKVSSGSADLLGLELSVGQTSNTEIAQPAGTGVQGGDLLSDLFGATPSVSAGQTPQPNTAPPQQNGFAEPNLFEKGNDSSSSGGGEQGDKKSTKDSIMALYGSGGAQPQMFGVPGGMYMPQQQMYGPGGMAPMMQQPQMMMGMQPGMMGQPMQQGMMGMPQMSGAMYGMGGGGMMGGGQGMMMGGAGFMQQQASQPSMAQQLNPMQQQMHFQQMQQQMASMALGGGSQTMGLQQQPQQTAVGAGVGGAWGGQATGHTLSNTLWQ
ncbi:stromal membrane-associated protein 2-like isoform X4 [Babylonia areolata]|uniref:stromal membrane-associated protein 2-like isoform X4 n=1 Tax=Babylonia areolata TaxID=304850 RepID=UPI003FD2DF5C